jgi:hypothetical protein
LHKIGQQRNAVWKPPYLSFTTAVRVTCDFIDTWSVYSAYTTKALPMVINISGIREIFLAPVYLPAALSSTRIVFTSRGLVQG